LASMAPRAATPLGETKSIASARREPSDAT
jgi:hypothetical protein